MTYQPISPSGKDQPSSQNSFLELKRSIINPVLWLFSIIALTVALATLPANLNSGSWFAVLLLAVVTGWFFTLALKKTFSYVLKAVSIIAGLYFYSIYALISTNILIDGKIILGCFIAASFIFISSRLGIISSTISVATVLISGGLILTSQTDSSQAILERSFSVFISSSLDFTLATILLALMLTLFLRKVESNLSNSDSSIKALLNQVTQLDLSNQHSSEEYKKNKRSFEITNQFMEQFSIESNPETVLNRAVTYIRSEFDYYYVAVFVPDEKNEFVVLKAGTGTEGTNLLSIGYQIKLSDVGLISHSFTHSEIRLSPNVREDFEYLENPYLLNTNSELIIPLIANQQILGVLDIGSDRINAFSPEDIKILRSCADQLASIYEKAMLKLQLAKVTEEAENTFKQFTQKTWKAHLRGNKKKYSYRLTKTNLEKEALQPIEVLQAINQGEPVVTHSQAVPGTGERSTSLAIPIKLRGQSIGALDIKLDLGNIPGDLMPLIETISDRLAVALENARLLEEIQNKADREHQVGEISSRIRSSPNVEQILRTAVVEIGQSLGASEVSIQLRSEQ